MTRARDVVSGAGRIVALTGAGISTDSGIPDFRGPQGVWTTNPAAERASTLQNYLREPEVRRAAWQSRLTHPAWTAHPNAGHRALVDLERQGRMAGLVTQNIDGLHQRAGSSPDAVIEVHGNVHGWVCWSCRATGRMEEMLRRVRQGEDDPRCLDCGGIVKSTTVSFGQSLDPDVMQRAADAAASADLLLAVGSTLAVHPVASLVPFAASRGAAVVIVNAQPTAYDDLAAAIVRTPISDALPSIVG